jgi:hypothetical protein
VYPAAKPLGPEQEAITIIPRIRTPTKTRKPSARPQRLRIFAIGSCSTPPMIVERILAWEIWGADEKPA